MQPRGRADPPEGAPGRPADDLGKLYWRTGKRSRAQEHLATTTMMYREMGMRFWLEKAGAGIRELE